jgi:putative transposase
MDRHARLTALLRYLRIGFSAVCGILCPLLIMLWVRSYSWIDQCTLASHLYLESFYGRLEFQVLWPPYSFEQDWWPAVENLIQMLWRLRCPLGKETLMTTKRRKRHSPEQIVRKLRDADALLNSGKELAAVLQTLEVSESTYARWRSQYGGMKAEEAVRLAKLEDENKRLKRLVADQALDIQMLKFVAEGNF